MVKETVSVDDCKEDGSVLVDVVTFTIISPLVSKLELLVELFTCVVDEITSMVGMAVGEAVDHIGSSVPVMFVSAFGVGKAVGLEVGQVWTSWPVMFAFVVGAKVGSMVGTAFTLDGIEGGFVTVGVEVMLAVIVFVGSVFVLDRIGEGNPSCGLSPVVVGFFRIGLLGFLPETMAGT